MINFEYYAPCSLEEALSRLDEYRGEAKILAGGTDLIVQMKDRASQPAVIIDIKNVPELNRLEWNGDETLHIGAAVPLSQIIAFPTFRENFSILHQACSYIGSMQIRNRGTMGGNICNAAPSADTVPSLLCLEARAIVDGREGTRTVPLDNFFRGPGETVLADNELLVRVEIPTPPTPSAGCYLRLTIRQEMDICVVGVASFLISSKQDNRCHEARIALGAVAPIPIRVPEAEAILAGKALTEDAIDEAAARAAEAARPISDVRGSAEYRREMVKALARRTLKRAGEALGIQT